MALSEETIDELAAAPKRTRTAEGTVEERSVSDLIKADIHTSAKAVSAVPWGIRLARLRPGSTTPGERANP